MLIDIHERRPDGAPGRLVETVERQPKSMKRGHHDWVLFDGEWFPVLTGVRNFICVPAERLSAVKIRAVPGRMPK